MTGARRRVSVIPHTHWDREWYAPFQTFRLRLVDLLDELLSSPPADGHFLLDGQVAAVDDYLAVRPDAEAQLRSLIGAGLVAIGPWYTLPDEFCVSGETLVRNLQLGLGRAAELGGAMEVGYLPDMFGHAAQMPQVLRLFGFDTAVVWRGVPAAVDRTAFWWSAPDGSTVRAEYLWHGYGNGATMPDDARALVSRVQALVDDMGSALVGDVLLFNGGDHLPPQDGVGPILEAANELSEDFTFEIRPLSDALRLSAQRAGATPLPRHDGELRSSARANLLMGVASNRVDVKQAAAAAERALERLAEPLSALWLTPAGKPWPSALLDLAWLEVIRNAAHDSSCACSVDAVCDAVLQRYAEATQIAGGLADRAVAALAVTLATPGAFVANSTARRRGGLVELIVPGEAPAAAEQLLEARPTVVSDRHLSAGEAWSWLLWFRSQRIAEDTYVNAATVDHSGDAVEVTLYCDRELRQNLLVEDIKREIRAHLDEHPDALVHLRILQEPSRRVLVRVEDVPGFGWRRWRDGALGVPAVTAVDGVLSNGLVTVRIDAASATFTLAGDHVSVDGLGRLVDGGDHGDTYNFSPPDGDVIIDAPRSVRVETLEAGPLRARICLLAGYRWPTLVDERRQRIGSVDVDVRTIIELRAGERFARVQHEWDNRCRDHRLRAVLPLPAPAARSVAECAFGTVTRGLHAEGGPTERGLATSFNRRFVQAGGLTVVHDGLLEYELTDRDGRSVADDADEAAALALTLVRSVGMLSRVDTAYRSLPAGPPLVTEGSQCQGWRRALYAVAVTGDCDAYAMADDVLVPLVVGVSTGRGDRTATSGQALAVSGAEVSALVRDEHGRLIVRAFNPSPNATTLEVTGRRGREVDLRGRDVAAFDGSRELRPWEIVTIRLDH